MAREQVSQREEASIRRRQTMRVGTIAIVAALAAALVIDNRHTVRLGYLIGDRDAPLIVALVAALAVGALLGWLAARRSRPR